MRTSWISICHQYLVLLIVCGVSVQAGVRFGPVIPPPPLQFSNVLLKSPAPFGILGKPLPNYEISVKDYPLHNVQEYSPPEGEEMSEDYHELSPESTFIHHHKKKHHHVVLHKHLHKGHVIHDHKHDGDAKHLHKHSAHAKHEHHHEGKGEHEHKHEGHGSHKHKHEGQAEHGHKHKGSGEHKHEHLGAGKHLHKHSGHSEHGHKHEAWAEHGHKHKGHYEHGHEHKGAGKHEHKHIGDADHKHKHSGHGDHHHEHKGHATFKHEHEGHGKHKHSHHGVSSHDHKHKGKSHHSHHHKGHSENKHTHHGSGYLVHHDEHDEHDEHEEHEEHVYHPSFHFDDSDFKSDLIDLAPKKKVTHKIKESTVSIDPSDLEEFIHSLRSLGKKEKKTPYDDHFEVTSFKKNQQPTFAVPTAPYDSFQNFKANNYIPKHKDTTTHYQPFSEDYLKFLSKYLPSKSYSPEISIKHGFSGNDNKKKIKYEVSEKIKDAPRRDKPEQEDDDDESEDEGDGTPNLFQYNVVHGKDSDIFPSMSYVSQVRGTTSRR